MGTETELKFRTHIRQVDPRGVARLAGSAGDPLESDLVSVYFDTKKHKLERRGLTLRVRKTCGHYVQTVKAADPTTIGRGEWEAEVEGGTPDLGKLDGTPLEALVSKKLRRKLKPIFETTVHRTVVPVHSSEGDIELAIDHGRIVAGRRTAPIEELELELKDGTPAELLRIARTIERRMEAELYLRSRAERGYALARGEDDQPVSAEPIVLEKEMPAAEAFRTIARACLRHFAGNADAVRKSDPEGIHQMRVGLRRLRAAISLFAKPLAGSDTERIKAGLKALTNELAPARELDVFVQEKVSPAAHSLRPRRGAKALQDEFASRRRQALQHAREAIESERYRDLLVDLVEWMEGKHLAGKAANLPIGKLAPRILGRRLKKARKQGRQLATLSASDRHKYRIRAKKLRYGIDFFESLFPGKRARKALSRVSKHLKGIQSTLGALNDFLAHREMAMDAALHAPTSNRRARALAAGVLLGREEQTTKPLLREARKEVRQLAGARVP